VLPIQETLIKFRRSCGGLSGQLGDGTLEMLGNLGFLSLGKGSLTAAFQYLQGDYRESGARLCTGVQREQMTDRSHKLE